MKKWNALLLAGTLALSVILTACGGGTSSTADAADASTAGEAVAEDSNTDTGTDAAEYDVTIKVGATAAPHGEILEQVIPVLAAKGITLEIVGFSDYPIINPALADGSLDANYFQHLPYLENYNEENDGSLVSLAGIHIEPMGVYPGKRDNLDDIEGALIGIPNDATNEGRALHLLAELGIITLAEDAGVEAEVVDIIDNPYNIELKELAAEQLPVSIQDLDFAVINVNYAISADISDTVLVNESGGDNPYVNVVVVREGDETRPELVELVNALQSDEIRAFITETYAGEVIPVF